MLDTLKCWKLYGFFFACPLYVVLSNIATNMHLGYIPGVAFAILMFESPLAWNVVITLKAGYFQIAFWLPKPLKCPAITLGATCTRRSHKDIDRNLIL